MCRIIKKLGSVIPYVLDGEMEPQLLNEEFFMARGKSRYYILNDVWTLDNGVEVNPPSTKVEGFQHHI